MSKRRPTKVPRDLWESEAYADSPEGATALWDAGFRPREAQTLERGMVVAFKHTDIFQLETVGPTRTGTVLSVSVLTDQHGVYGIEVCHTTPDGGEAATEADEGMEVWAKGRER